MVESQTDIEARGDFFKKIETQIYKVVMHDLNQEEQILLLLWMLKPK